MTFICILYFFVYYISLYIIYMYIISLKNLKFHSVVDTTKFGKFRINSFHEHISFLFCICQVLNNEVINENNSKYMMDGHLDFDDK